MLLTKPEATDDAICFLTATDLADAYRRRTLSPVEVTERMLARIAAINPTIKAYFQVDADGARDAAKAAEARWANGAPAGPLDGIPVSIKDHLQTRGLAHPRGSFLSAMTPSDFDAPVAARLRESGAVILGKTTMPELSVIPVTTSVAFGATLNPCDLSRSPGGSSGGAAAALAAGLCALSVGTDGGGSIRLPAAFTGLFGLKPTLGRVPYWPGQTDRTVAGPIARSAADAGLMMNVIARPDGRDWMELPADGTDYAAAAARPVAGLRIAYSRDFGFARVEPGVARAVDRGVAQLKAAGCIVEEIGAVGFDAFDTYMIQAAMRLAPMRRATDPAALARFPRAVLSVLDFAERIGVADVQRMYDDRNKLGDALLVLFRRFDAIVSPAAPIEAPPLQLFYPDGEFDSAPSRNLLAFACPFNLVHMPAVSAFCGTTGAGLPVGLQIAGPKFSDATLIALGAQVRPQP